MVERGGCGQIRESMQTKWKWRGGGCRTLATEMCNMKGGQRAMIASNSARAPGS